MDKEIYKYLNQIDEDSDVDKKIKKIVNINIEEALTIVHQNGLLLKYIDKNIQNYSKIAKEAVRQNPVAIRYVDKNIDEYVEIAAEAIINKPSVIEYVDKNIKEYETLLLIARELKTEEKTSNNRKL